MYTRLLAPLDAVRGAKAAAALLAAAICLLLPMSVSTQATTLSITLNQTFASVSGGTIIVVTPSGTFTDLVATVDGTPVTLLRETLTTRRAFSAPPHAAGTATLVLTDTANSANSVSITLTYVNLPVAGLATPVSRVNLDANGNQGTVRTTAVGATVANVSGDQRYALFRDDTDLGFGVPPSAPSLYRKDLSTGQLDRVFAGPSGNASMSLDGMTAAYSASGDVFVTTYPFTSKTRVDVNGNGVGVGGVGQLAMSGNGQVVAFVTSANLDANPADTTITPDLFVRDLAANRTERWTTGQAVVMSTSAVSADGRFVVFLTQGGLVTADTNTVSDVYMVDRVAGTVQLLTPPSLFSTASSAMISAGGTTVAFVSDRPGIVPGDTNNVSDVFVIDLPEGRITRVSVSSTGLGITAAASLAGISGNGRRVTFTTPSTGLTSSPLPAGMAGLYVHDRSTGQTTLVSAAADGTVADAASSTGPPTPDAGSVYFSSLASNLVPGDTNALGDAFLKPLPVEVPTGTGVRADPFDPVTGASPATLVFTSVSAAGTTSASVSGSGPALLPGFLLASPYASLETTASYAGNVSVCLNYAGASPYSYSQYRLLRYDGGTWTDVTTSVDWVRRVVCGKSPTLSLFAMVTPPSGYFANPAPTIASPSTTQASSNGGTSITIAGTGFQPGATVMVGGAPATVTSLSATSLTVVTPARVPGPSSLVIANPDGQSATMALTIFAAAAPTVTFFTPSSGPQAGGNSVTINGTDFAAGATVTIGGLAASVTSVTAGQIMVTMPPAASPGPVTAAVRNPDGQSATSTLTYTYVVAPVITSITPNEGPSNTTTSVTITGDNFQAAGTLSVNFGTSVAGITNRSAQSITVTAPVLNSTSTPTADTPVNVSVTTTGGTAILPNGFTYRLFPRITAVSPPSIPATGGEITIRGANFLSDATVVIGGVPAVSVVVDDTTKIRAVASERAAGLADVTVYTSGNTRTASLPKAVAFGPAPAVGAAGALVRANLKSDGTETTTNQTVGTFSGNGQFVVFISSDNGIVPGDANNRRDVFLRDLATGTTEKVNVPMSGGASTGTSGPVGAVSISDDGRYVVFATDEPLVAGDTNNAADVYLRDRTLATTERISLSGANAQLPGGIGSSVGAGFGWAGPVTPDGRYVVFAASGAGVTTNDTSAFADVFVRDRVLATTTLISVSTTGIQANASSQQPTISNDGRFVVFATSASNLGFNKTTATALDIVLRDRDTDRNGALDEPGGVSTSLVSRTTTGAGGDATSGPAWISGDGRFVVFRSAATNLVAGDTNTQADVFLFDRDTGAVARISRAPNGPEGNGVSSVPNNGAGPLMSADNRYVVFSSAANNLVPFDGNGATDLFRYDRVDGSLTLVSTTENGARSDSGGGALAPSATEGAISNDGTKVFFGSFAANLVAGDTNSVADLFVKTFRPSTPPGTSVPAAPVDPATGGSPVTLEFASVLTGGETTVTSSTSGTPLPSGFSVGTLYYDIKTTATLSGPIEICISYAGADLGNQGALRLMHYEGGQWVDVTSRIDTTQKLVCGTTTSLSPFAIAKPTPTALNLSASASTFGGTTDLSASVSPAAVPGSVVFYVNGAGPIPATYDAASGMATATAYVHGLAAAPVAYPVRAVFQSAATNYASSDVTQPILSVTKAAATVGFVASELAQQYDGNVKTLGTTVNPAGLNVVVTFTGTPRDAGTYPVSAVIDDPNYEGSAGATLQIAQRPASITTAPAGKTYGGPDPSPLTTAALSGFLAADGITSVTLSRAPGEDAGVYAIAATPTDPAGRIVNYAVTNAGAAFTIAPAPTSTQVVSSQSPSLPGAAVTFTATVVAATGPVTTGSVQFLDGTTSMGAPVAVDGNGQASLTTSNLAAGAHTIVAQYSATKNFGGSSGSVAQVVSAPTTAYVFSGFFAPIDMPSGGVIVRNRANAGQAIPVRWRLVRGAEPVSSSASFKGVFSSLVNCTTGQATTDDAITEYAPGDSALIYLGDGSWQYNWKTPKSYANSCRVMFVKFDDDTTSPVAYFAFK